jgi:hypothetical protein
MDPIIKALHETWKKIVSEEKYEIPKGGLKDPSDYVEPDGKGGYRPKREKEKDPFGNKLPTYDVGLEIGPGGKFYVAPKKPKPTPTPGKTPYDDRGGDAPQLTKTPYDVRGGSEDNVPTPTPKPTSGYEPSPFAKAAAEAFKKHKGTLPEPEYYYGDGDGPILKRAEERATGKYKELTPDRITPIIPTRTRTPQPAAPATTGSGLLSIIPKTSKDVLGIIPKPSKNMFSIMPETSKDVLAIKPKPSKNMFSSARNKQGCVSY